VLRRDPLELVVVVVIEISFLNDKDHSNSIRFAISAGSVRRTV
jgi:hypothetical protein